MTADTGTEPVLYRSHDGIASITLNRPKSANAIDLVTAHRFAALVRTIDPATTRVVTLRGSGARFCGGGDVAAFAAADDQARCLLQIATTLGLAVCDLDRLPVPVIAGVHGAVAGAGLGVMLAADITVAGRSTKFTMAYGGVGLTPDCGVSYLLPRAIGSQRALELALTGRVLDAVEARDWGLVTEVVDDDQVAARVEEIAHRLAGTAPSAAGQARRLLRAGVDRSLEETVLDEARTIAAAVETSDAQHLIGRFLQRSARPKA